MRIRLDVPRFGDPLGLLARLVDHLHLNPIRVPQYFILTLVIPGSTIRHSTAWPLTRLRVGDAVVIIYLARRPEKGIVNSWVELYFPAVVFAMAMITSSGIFVGVLTGRFD
jgi:hypothetical protein